ncbi:carboxypeptidase-like regulatory domain-containing protein [Cohnella caldifontis]|uniref:carboxypeptidase-like regulatory domain-containing protein n=1 Tax=Cohnella caldifontis TaxID=3027471 RepID=UPI0023EC5AD6|nr:carboxypeptidase-like regulatory domain-containing protein [Cohnella sp. YIM B05605]
MLKRWAAIPAAMALALGVLAGCTDNAEPETGPASETAASAAPTAAKVSLSLDQATLSVQTWKMDNSHMMSVKGKVQADGQPVSGVEVNLADKRSVTTGEDGAFEFRVDRSIPQSIPIRVKSADKASVAGKPLDDSTKSALLAAESFVQVYHPIQITEVKAAPGDPDSVEVHARAVMGEGEEFPTTKLANYAIKGTVKDAGGNPVKGAEVSFYREHGEGWAKSAPSDENGAYMFYTSPEEDEDATFQVFVGDTKYTLPENRVYHFPEDTSSQVDITLPAEGTVIVDKPPTLVSQKTEGAVYWSQMYGLSVGEGVSYTITLPDKDGSFVVTVPKSVWDQSPTFYETRYSRFLIDPIAPGDPVSSADIPAPQPGDPQQIVPEPAKS